MLNTLKTALKENRAMKSQNIFLRSPLHCMPLKSKFQLAYLSFIKVQGKKISTSAASTMEQMSSKKQPRISCHKLSQLITTSTKQYLRISLNTPHAPSCLPLAATENPTVTVPGVHAADQATAELLQQPFPLPHTHLNLSPLLSHKFSQN